MKKLLCLLLALLFVVPALAEETPAPEPTEEPKPAFEATTYQLPLYSVQFPAGWEVSDINAGPLFGCVSPEGDITMSVFMGVGGDITIDDIATRLTELTDEVLLKAQGAEKGEDGTIVSVGEKVYAVQYYKVDDVPVTIYYGDGGEEYISAVIFTGNVEEKMRAQVLGTLTIYENEVSAAAE